MAITETRQLREPFIEAAGMGITDVGIPLLKQQLDPTKFTGSQFVAAESDLEKQARTAATGMATGPDAYKDFLSPYQREVIDTSLAALDREQQKGLAALRQRAAQAGAFGGGREAAMLGEYEAQIRQQGFQQARQDSLQDLQAQQGLAGFQSQLGAQQRGLAQAGLTADQQQAREVALEPFTRLGLVAPQLASVIGGFPAQTTQTTTPPPSFGQQLLGLGIGAAGLTGAAKGFGKLFG